MTGTGDAVTCPKCPSNMSFGTDKSHDGVHIVQKHLPWASSIIPGTMMSARARSLTTERAVCSRALQVTLQELRVRTMSGEKTTLLQLQPVLNTDRKKHSSSPWPRDAGGSLHLCAWGERWQKTSVWSSTQCLKRELT